jgi:hypothetical protein
MMEGAIRNLLTTHPPEYNLYFSYGTHLASHPTPTNYCLYTSEILQHWVLFQILLDQVNGFEGCTEVTPISIRGFANDDRIDYTVID